MKMLLGVSWIVPSLGFVATVLTAPAPAPAGSPITPTDKIQALLWVIGVLVSAVGLLMVGVIWFLKQIKKQNDDDHTEMKETFVADSKVQWEHINDNEKELGETNATLSNLLGQHEVAFSLKGCAYEPERLKTALRTVLKEMKDEDKRDPESRDRDSDIEKGN
jgi:hypothetical protein